MIHFVLHDAKGHGCRRRRRGYHRRHRCHCLIMDEDREITVRTTQPIPIGHKVALSDMNTGDTVIKYGIDIGRVVTPIKKGEHAHVHNIKTKRW